MKLTDEQQNIVEKIKEFLNGNDDYFLLSAPAGTGKTFLSRYIYTDVYKKDIKINTRFHDFCFTATTNKAAAVLNAYIEAYGLNATTIHSFLGLRVNNNYRTGETSLSVGKDVVIKSNQIIVVDECSMINNDLFNWLSKLTKNCKFIFIGDDKQLPPVGEQISPIFNLGLEVHRLTKIIRSNAHQEITDVCNQLRETVDTLEFKDIKPIGNIHYCSQADFQDNIEKFFSIDNPDGKILTFTNEMCLAYNNFIATVRGQKNFIEEGRYYISNTPILYTTTPEHGIPNYFYRECKNKEIVYGDEDIRINKINAIKKDKITDLEYYECEFSSCFLDKNGQWMYVNRETVIKIPTSFDIFKNVISYLASKRDWKEFFRVKETFADLRFKDASTVHKAQGSTLGNIYIDLNDLSKCNNKELFARLIYVAFSRAKENIYLSGNILNGYGNILI